MRGYRRGAARRWPARRSGLEGRAEWCGASMEGHKWSGADEAGSCAEPAERVFILFCGKSITAGSRAGGDGPSHHRRSWSNMD